MPLGKYYCDYCDKQFQDTPFHRKRHLQGLHHQKAKALWYASVPPDPNQVSVPPSTTGVCNRFIRTVIVLFTPLKYAHHLFDVMTL
ncbi:putative matrin/U1-C-like, C2H2-type zinc finger, Zinc finger C2H2 superfamily [Helianthus annuus]|nr:putative matrin/U1-C-like, C2H2-type zinc finger, Zinc finger C2H2 superfamily [Helianthus annuus]